VSEAPPFDARELFAALSRHQVEYVTIGGIAVQAHGGQRLTQDLDIGIATSNANLERLAAALVDLDARILGPDGRRSDSVPSVALLGSSDQWHLITDHGQLDVIAFAAHLGSFDEIRDRAHETPLGEQTVPIASREDLLRMKRASGRPQDLADVQLLESLD
jgi:hypothetical protein